MRPALRTWWRMSVGSFETLTETLEVSDILADSENVPGTVIATFE